MEGNVTGQIALMDVMKKLILQCLLSRLVLF